MFGRRVPRKQIEALKELLWPSMGLFRLGQYYRHRMGRLAETPYAVAAGFAAGVAVSFTPFIGLHLLLAGIITWLLRGSLMAMVLGSVVAGNPWTYPFIWVATYKTGRIMLGKKVLLSKVPHTFVFTELLHKPMDLLLPMTLGCLPFAAVSAGLAFWFTRQVVRRYKDQRHARIRSRPERKSP